jgi:hypothetical protein
MKFNEFNQSRDEKMQLLEEKSEDLERQMRQRHVEQIEKETEELEEKLKRKPKPSPELLNLRRIQDNLAKQKE